jgi:zinc protease
VFVYENFASPAVVINGYAMAGSRDEPREKAGLAGFVSDCMTRGTQRYSYEQIYELTESIGASMGVSSGMHSTSFGAKSLSEDMPLMFDLLSDVLRCPTFPEAEIEKERAEWLTSLDERSNSTRARASMAFMELAYPQDHPYHHNADGDHESARAITREDVVRFHRDSFSPDGMVITVVGAVKAHDAVERIEAAFGDWRADGPARDALPPAPKVCGILRQHIDMPGKSQTSMLLGFPGPSRFELDWSACVMMNSILGQFGMYGRLGESVRKDEGLVYYIGSHLGGGIGPGAWYINAGINPAAVDRVVQKALAEVRRIQRRLVSTQELEDNQSYYIGVLPLSMETNEGIAGQINAQVRYDLGLDYLLGYEDRMRAITREDVRAAARKWLDADNYVLATAGT